MHDFRRETLITAHSATSPAPLCLLCVLAGVLNATTVLQRAQDGETETDLVVGALHRKSLSPWDMLMSSP
jgi:hypothetical protein